MTRRIHILPDAVADQIAAGEVVERPASVVKELAENALDAGATLVRITAEQGGRTLIEVADDGHGMERDDAVLALDRHATSKISSAADLVGVVTFGFRGEALPAIASVSRFSLLTSDGDAATSIQVTGGRIESVEPAARTRGTTVTVRSLFFNTPARRKFLRSASSESRAIVEAVATLALTYPAVAFELEMDGVRRLHVPPSQSPAERVESVWGRDLAGTLVPVGHAVGGFRVEGFAQRPGDARPTGRRVQLFINGRPFRDPFLVRAAEAGYRAAIHPGDRPSLLLLLTTTAADVDVNVHPAKLEVRFRDRLGAERAVEEAVRLAIGQRAAAVPVGEWRPMPSAPAGSADVLSAVGLFDETPPDEADLSGGTSREPEVLLRQYFRSFIVYESGDSVVFVDQHSAHERVLYEEVMAHLGDGGAASQRLLLPVTIELTDEELDAVEQHRELLERTGFAVESFGGRSVILQAVPAPHPRFDAELCFRELVADLARGRFGGWSSALERYAATYACRAAVKAGEPLAVDEMRTLLARLHGTVLPPHDVHGRATIVQLPREELERRFGRR
jgi:DNA mismatch repair protein MutL